MQKDYPIIKWGSSMTAYMYGTRIQYQADGSVEVANALVPSGMELQSWRSIQNYQASRTQPALPLLKKGEAYQLRAELTTHPAEAVFLKLTFLDRYDQEIQQLVEKSDRLTFVYPKEAYSYRISLLSAGLVEMRFHHLLLSHLGGDHVS